MAPFVTALVAAASAPVATTSRIRFETMTQMPSLVSESILSYAPIDLGVRATAPTPTTGRISFETMTQMPSLVSGSILSYAPIDLDVRATPTTPTTFIRITTTASSPSDTAPQQHVPRLEPNEVIVCGRNLDLVHGTATTPMLSPTLLSQHRVGVTSIDALCFLRDHGNTVVEPMICVATKPHNADRPVAAGHLRACQTMRWVFNTVRSAAPSSILPHPAPGLWDIAFPDGVTSVEELTQKLAKAEGYGMVAAGVRSVCYRNHGDGPENNGGDMIGTVSKRVPVLCRTADNPSKEEVGTLLI